MTTNPRLQRTRLRAPLSSRPFGGCRRQVMLFREPKMACIIALMCTVLFVPVACSSVPSQSAAQPECLKGAARPPEVRAGPNCKEIEAPVLLDCVEPAYPADIRRQRLQGKVVARAELTPDATLTDIRVVESPSAALSSLALEAFRQWRYKPAFCRDVGKPVRTYITMTTAFRLN